MQVVVGAIKNLRIHPLQKQMLAFSDSGRIQERNRLQQGVDLRRGLLRFAADNGKADHQVLATIASNQHRG